MSRQKGDIMRDVLISLKPYYYYLIGENIKKVEVRKSYPKAEDWSRNSWFYMSRDEKSFAKIPKEFQEKYRKHFGKVGMRFVCDRIYDITPTSPHKYDCGWNVYEEHSRLTFDEFRNYLREKNGYGWHITDLVVYDEPRELSEFKHECNGECERTRNGKRCNHLEIDGIGCDCLIPITKAPQSWQFCVATEPRQTED